jgi:predicted transcriptional regulator
MTALWHIALIWRKKHHGDTANATQRAAAGIQGTDKRDHHREAALLAEAFADIAAGRVVDEADVDAWIDSLGTDHDRPLPFASN